MADVVSNFSVDAMGDAVYSLLMYDHYFLTLAHTRLFILPTLLYFKNILDAIFDTCCYFDRLPVSIGIKVVVSLSLVSSFVIDSSDFFQILADHVLSCNGS